MAETFTPIGTTTDWWFWSLKPFNGKLYAGTYEMNAPKIYNYPAWTLLKTFGANGTAGESVLRLVEFKGEFYCNSECMGDEGHTYKMTTADPTIWTSVHHEVGYYPKPLIVFGDYFYAGWTDSSHNIKILRSSNGIDWSVCKTWSDKALLSFLVYNNRLYIVSKTESTGESWASRTSNGVDWADVPILCGRSNCNWSKGLVFNGKLYLSQDGGLSIYRYDETNLDKVLQVNVDVAGSRDLGGLVFDGMIYFLFDQSWKASSGNTYLYRSLTGNLNDWGAADLYGAPFHTFTDKQNGVCMAEFEGHLYLGIDGVVYQKSSPIPVAPSNCIALFSSPDKSYCTWEDNSSNEEGFRVEYRKNSSEWAWTPSKEMGGVLSLNVLPTPDEWGYCGFHFHILYGEGDSSYSEWITATGAMVFPFCNEGAYDAWDNEENVAGYFLADDTPYDVATVQGWYNTMKAKTDKPVGSIFWSPPNETDRNRLISMSNFLDFIMVYEYPYIEGRSLEDINAKIAYLIDVANDLNCPVLIGAQAFGDIGGAQEYIDPQEVGVRNQRDQYYAAGYPIWWYSWTNEDADVKRNHQDLMNEFYHGWTFFENKGINTTQSSLKQFAIGDNVKWRVRAYNAVGNSGWAVSDSIHISGGGVLGIWTSKEDFEAGTLDNILVPEGLHKLELEKLSLSGTGTWIFDGGKGRKFNWLSFVSTKPNQNVFYRDDFRDNSIADWTIEGGTWNCINQYMRGYADVDWTTNGMTVGYTSWEGVDILMKIYKEVPANGWDCAHHVWLRSDVGRDNGYLWSFSKDTKDLYRIVNDAPVESFEGIGSGMSEGVWRWWRLQIYTSGGHVFTRTRDWAVGSEEPGTWEYTKEFTSVYRAIGCIGVGRHINTGGKESRWDNILVSRQEGIPSPANCSISFKFWASNNGVTWESEYTDITKVPNSRFLKIEVTLSRTSLLSAMPTIDDMTLGYRLCSQPIFI